MNNFAFFIAGYGKPNSSTEQQLKKLHTVYPIYIVVGEDDPKLDEYKKAYTDNLIIFNKQDYIHRVDNLGTYAETHKICTYSRLVVDDFAKLHNIQYVGYLFDDIIQLRLRYSDNGIIRSIKDFKIDRIVDMYIELLNSSDNITIVGPPNSAFYIGINKYQLNRYSQRYGNFFIYDIKKGLVKDESLIKASVIEDMTLALYNNMFGRMSICPAGLQVICREPKKTADAYMGMSETEYYEQFQLITHNSRPIDLTKKNPKLIDWCNFTPKIISDSSINILSNNDSTFRDDFAIFILSHGRAYHMSTLKLILRCGYTGKWYIIIDNEDDQAHDYYELFGKDHVVMFDKTHKATEIDTFDMLDNNKAIVFARNACFDIAKDLGLTTFLQLDDDYVELRSRYLDNNILKSIFVQDINSVLNEIIEFLQTTNVDCVAFSQTGDFIGGIGSAMFQERIKRKIMNSFFCRVDRPFNFSGRLNEDVTTYVSEGSRGKIFLTIADITLKQLQTQSIEGGCTDLYQTFGTYYKSFYTVICCPSSVKVSEIGTSHKRIHHIIDWDSAVPKIVSSKFKK